MLRVLLALSLIVICLGEIVAQNKPNLTPPVVAIKSKSQLRHPDFLYGVQLFSSLGFGSGSGSMLFVPEEPPPKMINQEYVVTVNTSFRYSLGASFQYKKLQFGVLAGPEVYQVGEQILRTTFREPDRVVAQRLRDGRNFIWLDDERYVTRSPNTGEWPRYIFHYGLFVDYNINIGNKFRIAPTGGFNKYFYFATQPFENFNDKNLNDFFTGRTQYNFGAKFKVLLNPKAYFSLNVVHRVTKFDASTYLNDIRPESFEQSYSQTYFEFAYSYRLWDL
ncbi:MAG: hypothetical protein RIF33_17025 [Cyclobacteriaceae bacterium]